MKTILFLFLASVTSLLGQSQRWVPLLELPARATALVVIDDSTALVATAEGPSLAIKPALHMVRHDAIVWTMRFDTTKLPYFDYPHGEIEDIIWVGEEEVLLAFEYGHSRRVDLRNRTSVEVPIRPVNGFARSGNGTIVASARYRSTDEGMTWDAIDEARRPQRELMNVEGSSGATFFGIPEFSGVWRSIDGGESWSELTALRSTDDSLTSAGGALLVFDEQTIVVMAGNMRTMEGRNKGLYRTTDGGESWSEVLSLEPSRATGTPLGKATHTSNRMYAWEGRTGFVGIAPAIHDFNVYVTRDAGETWNTIDEGLPSGGYPGVLAMRGRTVLASLLDEPYLLYRLEGVSGVEAPESPSRMWLSVLRREE